MQVFEGLHPTRNTGVWATQRQRQDRCGSTPLVVSEDSPQRGKNEKARIDEFEAGLNIGLRILLCDG
jgi:hypothetical protein